MKRLAIPTLTLLIGCTSPMVSPDQVRLCGPRPDEHVITGVVKAAVNGSHLLDADSARVQNIHLDGPMEWREPRGKLYGWQITFWLNAKNAYGAYTGYQRWLVLVREDGSWFSRPGDAWHP